MTAPSWKAFRMFVLAAFLIVSPALARHASGQAGTLLEPATVESDLKYRFKLTSMDLRVLRPRIKHQNEELVLTLGKCIESENIPYMGFWDRLRVDREAFESTGLTGLNSRQIKALRTARQDSESEVANEWVSEYLQSLTGSLDLDWLQTEYATQLFQKEAQRRLDLLSTGHDQTRGIDPDWRKLTTEREARFRAILSTEQIRDYDSMTNVPVEHLIG